MKVVIFGASGRIGQQVLTLLQAAGHEAVPALREEGVDILTGAGVANIVEGADVVVDVTNSPSFEDDAVMRFFTTAAGHMLPAERAAGVKHHVALSVVGTDLMTDSGYMRAKVAQEKAITHSGIPYTIVRATQFFEFLDMVAGGNFAGDTIKLPSVLMQPIAAADVATALSTIVTEPPLNGIRDIAGPEAIPMDTLARRVLQASGRQRTVITDDTAGYFGAAVEQRTLIPQGPARLSTTTLEQWLAAKR